MEEFLNAAERVKVLENKPSDDVLLQLYGLYKQSTVGDINIPRPSFWDVKGVSKWEAWEQCQTIPKVKAMTNYVKLVKKLEHS